MNKNLIGKRNHLKIEEEEEEEREDK